MAAEHRAAARCRTSPGVYLFSDARGPRDLRRQGEVDPQARRQSLLEPDALRHPRADRRGRRHRDLVVATEAEALLTEQNFIKQYKPRFNIRLRDDKSYPYIAICLDEDFPRVYFTRERHRRERAYFGPYSSAKRVRGTLDLLGKIFQFRSCEGPEPGRHSGSPCLDYYIKRCGAPCVGYVSKEEYREGIDGVIAFLVRALQADRARPRAPHALRGRRAGLRAGDGRAQPAAGRAGAARAPAGRRRPAPGPTTRSRSRSTAPRPTRRSSRSATACSPTASRSTSTTRPSSRRRSWPRSSCSSTTRARSRSRR